MQCERSGALSHAVHDVPDGAPEACGCTCRSIKQGAIIWAHSLLALEAFQLVVRQDRVATLQVACGIRKASLQ